MSDQDESESEERQRLRAALKDLVEEFHRDLKHRETGLPETEK